MQLDTLIEDRLWTVKNFLSRDDCESFIQRSEDIGYEPFTIDGESFPDFRNNSRVILDDPALAESLWQGAAKHLPTERRGQAAKGFNPRFRFYRYQGIEAFAPHQDGAIQIVNQISQLTFLLYLADVASGGETRFYDENLQVQFSIAPQAGTAVAFDHMLIHEGVPVRSGTKYVLRTDVMFDAGRS